MGSKPIKNFTRSNLDICLDSISTASSFEMVEGIDSTTMLSFSNQLLADLEGMEKRCPQASGRQPWGRQAQSSFCLRISGRTFPNLDVQAPVRALNSIV